MKILKYKKIQKNKYKVYLEDNTVLTLHEDIIIKYNLLLTKEINNLNEIINDNNNYLIYDNTLKYISIKMRCESEIRNYLTKKNIEENLQESIIKKLKDNGLINDRLYIKSFISDKIRLNKYGIKKIKDELKKLKLDSNIIDEEINKIDKNDITINLEKLIDKKISSNKTYGSNVLKQKLLNEFLNKGYNREDILNILDNKDLNNKELYEKEYQKLHNKYKNKYSDSELEYIINQKLYQKGIKKED